MPASLFASAMGYHVLATGAWTKLRTKFAAPAEPSTAPTELHDRVSKFASTLISTSLEITWDQRPATYSKTFRRCWPSVVPLFPPTGLRADVSLKPSPGPSALMIVIVAPVPGNVVEVVDEEIVVDVVVETEHGQFSVTAWPTAFFRHTRESVAVVGKLPFGAQMQAGSHVADPTAARKMNRQSLAVGADPVVTG